MHSLTYIFGGVYTLWLWFVTAVKVNERGAGRAGEHRQTHRPLKRCAVQLARAELRVTRFILLYLRAHCEPLFFFFL